MAEQCDFHYSSVLLETLRIWGMRTKISEVIWKVLKVKFAEFLMML